MYVFRHADIKLTPIIGSRALIIAAKFTEFNVLKSLKFKVR